MPDKKLEDADLKLEDAVFEKDKIEKIEGIDYKYDVIDSAEVKVEKSKQWKHVEIKEVIIDLNALVDDKPTYKTNINVSFTLFGNGEVNVVRSADLLEGRSDIITEVSSEDVDIEVKKLLAGVISEYVI